MSYKLGMIVETSLLWRLKKDKNVETRQCYLKNKHTLTRLKKI